MLCCPLALHNLFPISLFYEVTHTIIVSCHHLLPYTLLLAPTDTDDKKALEGEEEDKVTKENNSMTEDCDTTKSEVGDLPHVTTTDA